MGEVISIFTRQPIINDNENPYIGLFSVGDTFISNDGVRVHIMESRWRDGDKLEYLFCAHGVKMWKAAGTFRRQQ